MVRLFKYTSFSRATDIIKGLELYVPHPFQFNDPYDFNLYFYTFKEKDVWANAAISSEFPNLAKLALGEVQKMTPKFSSNILYHDEVRIGLLKFYKNNGPDITPELERIFYPVMNGPNATHFKMFLNIFMKVGALCFMENPKNLLMWSHYADQHKGVCLEFEFPLPDEKGMNGQAYSDFQKQSISGNPVTLIPIEYSTKKPMHFEADSLTNDGMKLFSRQTSTKSLDWHYEQEWRMVFPNCFFMMDVSNYLKGVIPGTRVDEADKNTLLSLSKSQNLTFYQTELADDKFEIDVK